MSTFEVPLSPTPQVFTITMSGTAYQLRVVWNVPAQCWMLDINTEEGVAIAQGLPVITGANLLEQYAYLGIPGQLIVQTDHDTDAVPTYTNLGVEGHLYYLV